MTPAAAPDRLPAPPLDFACRAEVEIGAPIDLGVVEGQHKRVIPITGGRFFGPRLEGVVLPGGADWQTIRADGSIDVLARYVWQASDGTPITITNPGLRTGPPDVLAALARGEAVDPALYAFRTTPRFEVADESPHAWLARSLFVGTAARFATRVVLDFYRIG